MWQETWSCKVAMEAIVGVGVGAGVEWGVLGGYEGRGRKDAEVGTYFLGASACCLPPCG